jgi:hypothetical protein
VVYIENFDGINYHSRWCKLVDYHTLSLCKAKDLVFLSDRQRANRKQPALLSYKEMELVRSFTKIIFSRFFWLKDLYHACTKNCRDIFLLQKTCMEQVNDSFQPYTYVGWEWLFNQSKCKYFDIYTSTYVRQDLLIF